MITARQKVLAHLKKTRAATAREIARALKMNAPNVRHHLGVLASDGRIETTSFHLRGGRGRPQKVYSLSQATLGDNLAILADSLLSEKANMEILGQRIVQATGLIDATRLPIAKRLGFLVEKLTEMHYQARWEATSGGPRVIFGRCPYAKVIEAHPELCKMDVVILEKSLANPVMQSAKNEIQMRGQCPFIFGVR
jgi:predicted ArsR family transcriptional regulator